jgi:hypothetical protein
MAFRSDYEAAAARCASLERRLAEIDARAHELEVLRHEQSALRRELAAARRILDGMAPQRSLPVVQIASPCNADWNAMSGDDRVRFCGQCNKNVYNLSSLTSDEGAALVREKEGRLCVRFYRRGDGTMLTADCPVGLRRARFRKLALSGVGLGILAAGAWAAAATMGGGARPMPLMGAPPPTPQIVAHPIAAPEPPPRMLMGEVAMPTPHAPAPKARPKRR